MLFAAFGLPAIMPDKSEPMPLVMTVELLPVGEITNVKPSEKPIQQEKKAKVVKTTKPVTPAAPEKPKEPTPPSDEKKPFDPMEDAEPLPSDKPTPQDKPKEESKPKADDFTALLNKLQQEAKENKDKTAKDTANTTENTTRSDAPYDDSMPLSISEKDTIRSQFLVCWTMPAGAKDAHTLASRIKVELRPDGTVLKAELAPDQRGRYASDPFFRAAADSAIRAVHKCSPIKNLPPEKYNSWRAMELNFDPKDML
jgi:type IV secretory pathway VirB10-like protein